MTIHKSFLGAGTENLGFWYQNIDYMLKNSSMPKKSIQYEATVSFKTIVVRVTTNKGARDARKKIVAKINKKAADKYIEKKQFYLDKR